MHTAQPTYKGYYVRQRAHTNQLYRWTFSKSRSYMRISPLGLAISRKRKLLEILNDIGAIFRCLGSAIFTAVEGGSDSWCYDWFSWLGSYKWPAIGTIPHVSSSVCLLERYSALLFGIVLLWECKNKFIRSVCIRNMNAGSPKILTSEQSAFWNWLIIKKKIGYKGFQAICLRSNMLMHFWDPQERCNSKKFKQSF